ncbi:hypothetical protein FAI40_06250 [Acetobacteraceae bacterium]|nr:hypothetical protein FAI40_06250 [Acetobacteraceae bacterium]
MLVQKIITYFLIATSGISIAGCMVPDPDRYPDLDNPHIVSKDNIAYLNASINHKDSIPKPIKSMSALSPVNRQRLSEIGIIIPNDPNTISRYLTLYFTDGTSDSGVLSSFFMATMRLSKQSGFQAV